MQYRVTRYLNRHCSSWIFNDSQLQCVGSKFCEHYCVYFCLLRGRRINMRKFISGFTSDTGLNDDLVHASLYNSLNRKCQDDGFSLNFHRPTYTGM